LCKGNMSARGGQREKKKGAQKERKRRGKRWVEGKGKETIWHKGTEAPQIKRKAQKRVVKVNHGEVVVSRVVANTQKPGWRDQQREYGRTRRKGYKNE